MDGTIKFDYYYGIEAEQFSFYRVPRLLIKDARFKELSSDAKLLYGLMLDVDRQIICTRFIQIIFIWFCHIILLPSHSMHEVMQFILPILRIYCTNNSNPFFTYAAQGAAFLYLAIELSVYFLLRWKRILVKLSILPAQFRKQGRCRMAQSPVSVIFYVIVSFYQTVRQIPFMRNDKSCILKDPPAGRDCFQGPCNGDGIDSVHLL